MRKPSPESLLITLGLMVMAMGWFFDPIAVALAQTPEQAAEVGGVWGTILTIIGAVVAAGQAVMKWVPSGYRTTMNHVVTIAAGVGSTLTGVKAGMSNMEIGVMALTGLLAGIPGILSGIRKTKALN